MRRLLTRLGAAAGGASLVLTQASAALAQVDYEYTYDLGTTADDTAAAGLFGGFMLVQCCIGLVGLVMFIFTIWMLIHAIQNAPEDQKILWVLLIFFVPFASIFYFFTKKKEFEGSKSAAPKTE